MQNSVARLARFEVSRHVIAGHNIAQGSRCGYAYGEGAVVAKHVRLYNLGVMRAGIQMLAVDLRLLLPVQAKRPRQG